MILSLSINFDRKEAIQKLLFINSPLSFFLPPFAPTFSTLFLPSVEKKSDSTVGRVDFYPFSTASILISTILILFVNDFGKKDDICHERILHLLFIYYTSSRDAEFSNMPLKNVSSHFSEKGNVFRPLLSDNWKFTLKSSFLSPLKNRSGHLRRPKREKEKKKVKLRKIS
mgnify:FL=1|jgi:hypothetical protein